MTVLTGIFRWVLSLTAAGSLGVLLALGMKRLWGDRLGPRWNYLVWLLPLALYLVPVWVPAGNAPAAAAPAALPAGGAALVPAAPKPVPPAAPIARGGGLPLPSLPDLDLLWREILPVLALVWLLGLLLTAAVRLAEYRSLTRGMAKCSHRPEEGGRAVEIYEGLLAELGIPHGRVELLICPGVESPLLLGLWRPRVVLPREDCGEARLEMMLRHELNHYRGRDLWLKAAALGAACVHWFNPLAGLLVKDLDRCCELWCDQRTTAGMDSDGRRQYGRMLLDVAQGQGEPFVPAGAALAMNKEELKHRLELLRAGGATGPRARAAAWLLALMIAAAGTACSAATNPGPEALAPEPSLFDAEGDLEEPKDVPAFQSQDPAPPESAPGSDEAGQPEGFQDSGPVDGAENADEPPAPASTPALVPEGEALPAEEETAEEETPEVDQFQEGDFEKLDPEESERLTRDLTWDKALIWPVDGGSMSAGFHDYPGHTGMDIKAAVGTEIYAAADGVVTYAVYRPIWPYGKSILIDHGGGVTTYYAHCSEVLVKAGDTVKRGDLIGKVGRSGNATGYVCHFELQIDGEAQDPSPYTGTTPP